MKKLLRIGYIIKPQGVRGELKIEPLSDDPNRFNDLTEVILQSKNGEQSMYVIESCVVRMGFVYVVFQGFNDRAKAEALRGKYICVTREDAVELPEGHHFVCDLLSCEVVTNDGQVLGKIMDILQHGAADVYVVKGEKSCMFPALKRLIVDEDIKNKRIVVDAEVLKEVVVWDEDED